MRNEKFSDEFNGTSLDTNKWFDHFPTWKGRPPAKFTGEANSNVADGRFKADAPNEQLYDLVLDSAQTRNVVREHPEVAERLKARLAGIQSQPRSRAAP